MRSSQIISTLRTFISIIIGATFDTFGEGGLVLGTVDYGIASCRGYNTRHMEDFSILFFPRIFCVRLLVMQKSGAKNIVLRNLIL
jgi:hypothetical protein